MKLMLTVVVWRTIIALVFLVEAVLRLTGIKKISGWIDEYLFPVE